MEKYYEDRNLSGIEVKELSRIDGEGDPKPGKYGKYRAGYINRSGYKNTSVHYVKNTRDGLKINWEATAGYNEPSWKAFEVSRPTNPIAMRVEAVLENHYSAFSTDFAETTHYSILFGFVTFGYARKDSRLGKRLFNILKDGERHNLVLSIHYLSNHPNKHGIIEHGIIIDDLVSEDWLIR